VVLPQIGDLQAVLYLAHAMILKRGHHLGQQGDRAPAAAAFGFGDVGVAASRSYLSPVGPGWLAMPRSSGPTRPRVVGRWTHGPRRLR
jgi:hypothetical protein